ncbi:phage tail terminator-like protein [Ancylobacter sp. VNQ12]|uniref:phage tail terminator-like protein n=1 Tax=Ancylobacter sp. VNQ12 TaxID=3400920 RepID=UPI003C0C552E
MSTAPEAIIQDLLFGHLATLTPSPAWPVDFPDTEFSPPSDGRWLEARLIRNANGNLFLANDDETRHLGLLQVSVMSPIKRGSPFAMEIAGAVVDHFSKGTRLFAGTFAVRVYEKPSVAQTYRDGAYLRTPVTVRWQTFI